MWQRVLFDLENWREVIGRISATFSTPLPDILKMNWDEAIKWWMEAMMIETDRAELYLRN